MKDKTQGTWDQTKGKIKEGVGKATDDTSTEWSGKADQVKGKAEKTVGDIKDRMKDEQAEERERADATRP